MASPAERLFLILAVFVAFGFSLTLLALTQIHELANQLTVVVVLSEVLGFGGLIVVELYSFLCKHQVPTFFLANSPSRY